MQQHAEIVERDGKLFILDSWETEFSRPIQYRNAWPTGLRSKDYPDLVGAACIYAGNGTYEIEKPVCGSLLVGLEHRGETRPDRNHTEERPVQKPKKAREWRRGEWV